MLNASCGFLRWGWWAAPDACAPNSRLSLMCSRRKQVTTAAAIMAKLAVPSQDTSPRMVSLQCARLSDNMTFKRSMSFDVHFAQISCSSMSAAREPLPAVRCEVIGRAMHSVIHTNGVQFAPHTALVRHASSISRSSLGGAIAGAGLLAFAGRDPARLSSAQSSARPVA